MKVELGLGLPYYTAKERKQPTGKGIIHWEVAVVALVELAGWKEAEEGARLG